MYFSTSVILIVSFSGCYLEAFCNFASILKHCKEFTASMRQPLLPPKYFLSSSIPGHLAHLPLKPLSPTFSWQIWYNFSPPPGFRPGQRGSYDRMLAPCLRSLPSRRLNTISGPDSVLSHSQTEIKLFCRVQYFLSQLILFCWVCT